MSSLQHPELRSPLRAATLAISLFAALLFAPYLPVPLVWAQDEDPAASSADPSVEAGGEEPAEEEPAEEAPTDGEDKAADSKKVLYGTIDDTIDLAESAFLRRLLEAAEEESVDTVLIKLNTFGGRVDAAVAMRDALLDSPFETVMWINKRAISAGALISLACNRIAIAPGSTIGAAMPVSGDPSQELPEPVQEKYLSYFRQEMRVTAEARDRDGDIAEAFVDADVEVEGVSEKGKLLTLNTRTALETGIADFEAADLDAVLAELGSSAESMITFERSWSEDLVGFLTGSAITSLLVFGMMLFGYLELQSPGFGIFGGIAVACFAILYFSHYLVNLAGHEELLLIVLGLLLLAVEIFVLPGVGIFAALGAACVLAATIMVLMAGDWSQFTIENPFTLAAAQRVAITMVVSFVAMLAAARVLIPAEGRSTRGGLLLNEELSREKGYRSHGEDPSIAALIGKEGEALSDLRPSGKAFLEGKRVDVETEGDWIERGESIVVVRRSEGRLVVRRA